MYMLSSPSSVCAKKARCYESWGHQKSSLALPSPGVDPHGCTLPTDKDSHFSLAKAISPCLSGATEANYQPCLWMCLGYSLPSSSVCALISSCFWLHSLGGPWTCLTTLPGVGLLWSLFPAASSAHSAQVLEDISLSLKSLSCRGHLQFCWTHFQDEVSPHLESWTFLSSIL